MIISNISKIQTFLKYDKKNTYTAEINKITNFHNLIKET